MEEACIQDRTQNVYAFKWNTGFKFITKML